MKRTIFTCVLLSCFAVFSGCGEPQTNSTTDGGQQTADDHADHDHAALHKTKHEQVKVEFPGHKYAMEIINENEDEGLVAAFLTDAHFDPTEVDTQEVRLNFVVDGQPKAFVLPRVEQEAGQPAKYTLQDKELSELICDGWKGDATASIEVGGNPFNAKLVKLSKGHGHNHDHGHAHGHDHHGHSH